MIDVAFRILGYIEFGGGQATAGQWATAPSKIQLFGPGIKKAGDVAQVANFYTSSSSSSSSASLVASNVALNITPTSAANLVNARAQAQGKTNNTNVNIGGIIIRGGSVQLGAGQAVGAAGTTVIGTLALDALDAPNTASSIGYALYYNSSTGGDTVEVTNGSITLTELMA